MYSNYLRKLLITLLFLISFLISCSALPPNVAGTFTQTFKAVGALVYGYEDYPITQDLIDQIPYASLRMKIGKGPAGLLILESINNNEYTWVSSDNIFITTKGGRIVRAQGLNNNLVDFFSSEPSFYEVLNGGYLFEQFRYISLDNPEVVNLKLKISYKKVSTEKITILNQEKKLILIEESIENSYIRWRHTNRYWVDEETGFVWQSIQEIAPNIPPILIQITKKPS